MIGPGSYNLEKATRSSKNMSSLGQAPFASKVSKSPYDHSKFSGLVKNNTIDFAAKLMKNEASALRGADHGIPANMEQYIQRETVGGKYMATKKINKLS